MMKTSIKFLTLIVLWSTIISSIPLASATGDTWNTVITITGRGYKTSELFSISASQWRISWSYTTSTPDYAGFNILVYPRWTTVSYVATISADGPSQSDVSYVYEGDDDFYIEALVANLDSWTIVIEQQGPIPDQPEFVWDTIGSFSGQGYKTSAPFTITTSFWRYRWEYTTSSPDYAGFHVYVYPEGETSSYVNAFSVDGPSASDDEYVYDGEDNFYFDVLAANLDSWSLTIQQPRELLTTSLTCLLSANTIELDDAVIISGSITPPMSVEIMVAYKITEWVGIALVNTDASGHYTYSWIPETSNEYEIVAYFDGDATYALSVSNSQFLIVNKRVTEITCTTSSTNLSIGAPILLEGVLTPAQTTSITLQYSSDTTWKTLTTLSTQSDGSYSYTWTPTSGGSYTIRASYTGDDEYNECTSTALSLNINKLTSSLTCTSTSTQTDEGKPITIIGTLSPAVEGVTVNLVYQPPSGSTIMRSVTTNAEGEYSDTYTPTVKGSWTVTTSWGGDDTYEDATSSTASFTVGGSGCLIATATFGSELTPQVQFLRNFRDNRVLQTFAGSQFMKVFNSFYYSWSPRVADTIRANVGLSTPMKGVLYPLIGVLQFSERLFAALSFNPELGVVVTGFIASALLTTIYLTPLALVFSYLRKYRPSKTLVSAMGLIWLASLTAIGLAELIQTPVLMMTATGTFVLATLGSTLLMAMRQTPKLIAGIKMRALAR